MSGRLIRLSSLLCAAALAAGCAGTAASSRAGGAGAEVVDRLFLGRDTPGGGRVSDEEWARFVAEVVTPRFPNGLTLWRAEGQWLGDDGSMAREPVMVLEIVHDGGAPPGADAAIRAIAGEYKRRFRQEAVLHVRAAADVRLIR